LLLSVPESGFTAPNYALISGPMMADASLIVGDYFSAMSVGKDIDCQSWAYLPEAMSSICY